MARVGGVGRELSERLKNTALGVDVVSGPPPGLIYLSLLGLAGRGPLPAAETPPRAVFSHLHAGESRRVGATHAGRGEYADHDPFSTEGRRVTRKRPLDWYAEREGDPDK